MSANPTNSEPRDAGLLEALRTYTQPLHVKAERTGIVRDVLRGDASRFGYALLLRNLLPAYEHLEREFERLPTTFAPGIISAKALHRANAIRLDLEALYGSRWETILPLLVSGESYGAQILNSARENRTLLIAHAYVRYLGDLNGGQILKRILLRKTGLPSTALNFYMFPDIEDINRFKVDYVDALAVAVDDALEIEAVAREAAAAFNLNIQVSLEVKSFTGTD
jgi:heme oxygenase